MISLLLRLEKCQLLQDTVYIVVFLVRHNKCRPLCFLPILTSLNFTSLRNMKWNMKWTRKIHRIFAMATNVSKQIELLWQKASIPISRKRDDYVYIWRSIMSNSLSASTLNCGNLSLYGASFLLAFLPDLKMCLYFSWNVFIIAITRSLDTIRMVAFCHKNYVFWSLINDHWSLNLSWVKCNYNHNNL